MARAEEKALLAYPPLFEVEDFYKTWDLNEQYREPYIDGYKQAERDFVLAINQRVAEDAIPCNIFLHDNCAMITCPKEQFEEMLKKIGADINSRVKLTLFKDN